MSLGALRANKFRSMLTTLGVSIGVGAVILLVALGSGVKKDMTGQIQGLGSNLIFVFASTPNGGSAAKTFTMDDVQLVKSRLTGVEAVEPMMQMPATARRGNKTLHSVIMGGDENASRTWGVKVTQGRMYHRSEGSSGARVAVIGETVKRELFGNSDPIGKEITVEGQRLKVIGIQEKRGGAMGGDNDNIVMAPLDVAFEAGGTRDLQMIVIKVKDPKDIKPVEAQVKRILRPRYSEVTPFSQDETVGMFDKLMGMVTILLAGIASISLLVGGIGIMNIMLVSVTERTREIGIRKAVGAKTGDVLTQFVIEAIVLSLIGGVAGVLLGGGGAAALSAVVTTQIELWSVAMALTFSIGIGVFFGVYPAMKASRLDPIVALRHD
jgi:putative ABC transport system permease protein